MRDGYEGGYIVNAERIDRQTYEAGRAVWLKRCKGNTKKLTQEILAELRRRYYGTT